MKKQLSVGQNTLYNSIGSLFYLICQWLMTVVVVHLASVEDAGILSLAMSITNMLFTLCTFGIRTFQVSDYRDKYSATQYVTTRLFSCLCASLLCVGVVLVNRHYTLFQAGCILIYMLFRVGEAVVDVMQGIQQKAGRMDYICYSFLMRGVLLLGSFCLALYLTGNLLVAFCSITAFTLGVILCYDFTVSNRLSPFRIAFDLKTSCRLLWECTPLMCTSFMMSAAVSIPRSALESAFGSYTLGIYASVATPAVIVQSAVQWLYNPVLTTFTRYYSEGDKKRFFQLYYRMWGTIGAAFLVILAGARLLGHWGLSLLFVEEVADHYQLLIPVLGTTILIACSYFLAELLTIARAMKPIMAANAVSMVLVLLLSRPLIQSWGMNGVNYVIYIAMGACVVILLVVLHIVLRRHFRASPDTAAP